MSGKHKYDFLPPVGAYACIQTTVVSPPTSKMSFPKIISPSMIASAAIDEKMLMEIAETCHVSADQIEDVYECTPMQLASMAESTVRSGVTFPQLVMSLAPFVDHDRFCVALQQVVRLNSVLRTRLVDCRIGLVQVVTSEDHHTQRWSGSIAEYLHVDKASLPDLGVPLLRSAIIDRSLVLTMHHAIMDHSTLDLLLMDVLAVYRGKKPELRAPFRDFVAHCIEIDESEAKSFWRSRFKGAPAIFPKVESGYVPRTTTKVTRKVALNQSGPGVSLAHLPSFIEAAWALTAGVYTCSESVVFGLILSGRSPALAGAETTMGPTIATIPVQVNLQRDMTIEKLLRERTTALRQIQRHPALQYGTTKIRAVTEAARIASGFQTLLNIRPLSLDPNEWAEVTYERSDALHVAFSLCLSCKLMSDEILVEMMFDPAVLMERQLHRVLNQFEHTLKWLMGAPLQSKIGELELLNPHDRSEIFQRNETVPEPVEECIHELFVTQARKQPSATAVEASDGSASYFELDEMSDRLAHELRRMGVSVEDPVAFIFEKSLWTIVAILAIMKAGGACVPINKSDPRARQAAIIASADAKTILTSSVEHVNAVGLATNIFAVSASSIAELPDINCPIVGGTSFPRGLAYILFTSGSMFLLQFPYQFIHCFEYAKDILNTADTIKGTGVPKGVMLEHRCLASSLTFIARRCGLHSGGRMLHFAAHVFDASIGEIFGTLLFGGCLCIPSEDARESNLVNFIISSKINWAWLTPTVIRTISPEEVPGLQSLLSLGEPVGAEASKTWSSALHFFNGWGPCETSILSTVAELTPGSRYPESIGAPVGCAVWIVDPRNMNELVPIGTTGEVLIEGPGVARGYLNDDAKTAAFFVRPPPWAPSRGNKTTRFYRTGDLARYYPDGSICFVGRQDNQVKIRGQRFELGELECVLASCSEVRDVFTTTKICDGRTELVALICLTNPMLPRGSVLQEQSSMNAELTTQCLYAVRDHVRSRLPLYMVPTVWLAIEQMPRTASAKLDRASINKWLKGKNLLSAKANLDAKPAALTPPVTPEERLMQSVWSSVLGVPQKDIGRESSFFQLGGDSILAMQAASRCRKLGLQTSTAALLTNASLTVVTGLAFATKPGDYATSSEAIPQIDHLGGVSQPADKLFSAVKARISQLSLSNANLRSDNLEGIAVATDSQAIMLAVGRAGGLGCHVNFTLKFTPALNTERLRRACHQVIRHHPILRTVFFQYGPVLYQVVVKNSPSESVVEKKETPVLPVSFDERLPTLIVTIRDGTILARFHIFYDGPDCGRLTLEIHHALYDAISLGLIFKDLDAAYACRPLSDGPHFHSWISQVESSDRSGPREFWRETLRDSSMSCLVLPPVGALGGHPLDERIEIRVPLRDMQTSFGTPSSVLKAAWSLLLSCALGMEDIVFGEISANRYLTFPGIDQVRGPCLNHVPVRARLDHGMTLASLITQIQDQTAAALPYHSLGFRSIVKECTAWPRETRFSSAVVYQNHGSLNASFRMGNADCALSGYGNPGDSADIWIIATPLSKDLKIELNFSSHTLPSKQMRWISRSLAIVLEAISSSLEQSTSQIKASLVSALGIYVVSPSRPAPSSDLVVEHSNPPSAQACEIVLRAWEELELLSENKSENCSIFCCGADVVTILLLSEYYHYRGYDISIQEIIRNPSRLMQAYLVDVKADGIVDFIA